MAQFTSLIQEMMPAWLQRRSQRRPREAETGSEPMLPQDADAVWRKAVEKDLFGANTPDYAETGEKRRNRH
ncbi:MAG: hypothetical protein E5V49_04660 [Mesorhizobium sp.]|nr:hypothetical protein EN848_05140 [bacterium M00.F.Ca.ET.205.01.1.1]TGU53475.1 hypothetical protein EN795_09555 [bacterium M00.F.Ca.ET.152.01.1.1]TGV36981.1 hypothetical protein EN829_009580 [Mesorhizobium sp. M00.F.Ca.ET.186.01.1.1]TGZ41597.1 hypothetical protein EN805_18870 [bacterium M00.F.Ca.ET.162.01.1.1]TIW62739.1 MAG: hypothetical protein E5V48_03295 [Mesorhizobium sp.]